MGVKWKDGTVRGQVIGSSFKLVFFFPAHSGKPMSLLFSFEART
jgi:hypothetical protein